MTGRPRPDEGPDWPALAGSLLTLVAEVAAAEPDPDHDPRFCRVCPLCRLVARLQAVRPDLADQLTSAAEGVGAALQALLAPMVPQEVAVPRGPDPGDRSELLEPPGPAEPRAPGAGPDPQDDPPGWPSTVRPPIERIEVTG